MAIFEAHLSRSEAIMHNMWKLMGNVIISLYRVEKIGKSIE